MKELQSIVLKCEAKIKKVSVFDLKPIDSYLKGTESTGEDENEGQV